MCKLDQHLELAYIDVVTGEVTWLNTSVETGYWDGIFAEARFLRGEQMCSDDAGNIYIVDQDIMRFVW